MKKIKLKFFQKITFLSLLFFLLVIYLVSTNISKTVNINPSADNNDNDNFKLALRVPSVEVYSYLRSYMDGTRGEIPFIFYGRLDTMEELFRDGATQGNNPAELGVLVGCDWDSIETVRGNIERYQNSDITYLMQDCERGDDNLWSQPDLPKIAETLNTIINSSHDFRWQVAMQFGYLENTYGNGGDLSICDSNDLASCDIASSFAARVWGLYNDNDIVSVFGQSGSQLTPQEFEALNLPWVNYIRESHPRNEWWGISGLVDKNGNGEVDLSPQTVFQISQKAKQMGAGAFGIIWLGRSEAEMIGPQTEMDEFLNLWVQNTSPDATQPPGEGLSDGELLISIEGVTSENAQALFNFEFYQQDQLKYNISTDLTSGIGGVFSFDLTQISDVLPDGIYDIRVKTDSHLAKRFENIQFSSDQTLDFSEDEDNILIAGDATGDNMISIEDIARVSSYYLSFSVQVDGGDAAMKASDINKDGYITIADLALVAINWSGLQIRGE